MRVLNVVFAAFLYAMAASAADPFVGEWLLNPEQSRISSGLLVNIARRGEALRYSSAGVEFTALFDGDDYRIQGVSSHATVSLKRIDNQTLERTYKRDGKPVSSAILTVSPDRRFLTVRIRRLNADGRQWVNTYRRVSGEGGKDPFEGVWERSPARSLGNSPVITFEWLPEGRLHFSGDQVEYSAGFDSQEHKVSGTIVADSVSLKRIDSRTLQEAWTENGMLVATVVRVVSADGTSMTTTATGTTRQGNRFENVFVYHRK